MDPWLEIRIKELHPLFSNMKNQRPTQKEVTEAKAGSNSPEIEKIPDIIIMMYNASITQNNLTCTDSALLMT